MTTARERKDWHELEALAAALPTLQGVTVPELPLELPWDAATLLLNAILAGRGEVVAVPSITGGTGYDVVIRLDGTYHDRAMADRQATFTAAQIARALGVQPTAGKAPE